MKNSVLEKETMFFFFLIYVFLAASGISWGTAGLVA